MFESIGHGCEKLSIGGVGVWWYFESIAIGSDWGYVLIFSDTFLALYGFNGRWWWDLGLELSEDVVIDLII